MATPEDPKQDRPLDHHHNSAPRKLGPSTANTSCRPTVSGAASAAPPDQLQPPPALVLRCPRCDSTNTKFCYYNNYSLSQPRHFCKTCRRYWTKGGALRNVPIGGGCRKNKKLKSSSSSSSIITRLSSAFDHHPKLDNPGTGAISPSSSAHDVTGFRFFPPSLSPPVDFQLSGLSSAFDRLPIPFSPYADSSNYNSRFALEPPVGFSGSYPSLSSSQSIPSGVILSNFTTQEVPGSLNIQSNLASSIESLSSLNQDLHWKLQQQRLAMLLGSVENQKDAATFASSIPSTLSLETQVVHKPQPHPFQNQEFMPVKSDNACSRKEGTGEAAATEWFFGNSYNSLIPDSTEDAGNGTRSVQTWGDGSNQHEFGAN